MTQVDRSLGKSLPKDPPAGLPKGAPRRDATPRSPRPRAQGRNQQRPERLTQIMLAARSLFERHGYHSTTMQDIAGQAGMSVGLIYQYAANKEDVLLLVITEILEGYTRDVPNAMAAYDDPVERLAAGFAAYCRVVGQRRDAVVLAYRETRTLSRPGRERLKLLESNTTELLTAEVRKAIDDGLFVPYDSEIVAYDLIMLAHGWALKHWYLADVQTLDSYIALQTSLVFRGLIQSDKAAAYAHLLDALVPAKAR
jgi:AcrR family transcriptional regulator